MRRISEKEREKLTAEIAGLESLDLIQLRIRWRELYKIDAPPHLSRDWLRCGGLSHTGRSPARIRRPTPNKVGIIRRLKTVPVRGESIFD